MTYRSNSKQQQQFFYHRLNLIFIYYAYQGQKQDPFVLRQKNFQKFLIDSTISQLVKQQNQSQSINTSNILYKSTKKISNKNYQVIINTINKPIHFQQFKIIITDLIFSIRQRKNWEQVFQDQNLEKNLFIMCKTDTLVYQIFQILYDEILNGTEFGKLIKFSQSNFIFTQKVFMLIKEFQVTLKIVYFNYFRKELDKANKRQEDILQIVRKMFQEFQICPNKISFTQIYVLYLGLNTQRSVAIFQQIINKKSLPLQFLTSQQWKQFDFIQFSKLLIMISYFIQLKQNKFKESSQDIQVMVNFLQKIGVSKGYKKISQSYKILKPLSNVVLFNKNSTENDKKSKQTKQTRQTKINKSKISSNIIFKSKQLTKSKLTNLLIQQIVTKLLNLIFQNYSSNLNDSNNQVQQNELKEFYNEQKVSQKQFQLFCSQYKIVPILISRRQAGQIYFKIFSQRDFYQINQQISSQSSDKFIKIQNTIQIIQKMSSPQLGLTYQQFLKFLILFSQTNKICPKFNPQQRLIFLLDYLNTQQKTKLLIAKLRQKIKQILIKQSDYSLDTIFKSKQSKSNQIISYGSQYQSMLRKLKNSIK